MSLPTAEPGEKVDNESKGEASNDLPTNLDNDEKPSKTEKVEDTKASEPPRSPESAAKVETTSEENVPEESKNSTSAVKAVTNEEKVDSTDDLDSKLSVSGGSDNATGDTLFEPSVEMMVNDFDDERTLEEEEALAATEAQDPSTELSSLEREKDMPIDELLALYNCSVPPAINQAPNSSSKRSTRSRGRRSSRSVTSATESKDSTSEIKENSESKDTSEKMETEEVKLEEIEEEKTLSADKKESDHIKVETNENGADAVETTHDDHKADKVLKAEASLEATKTEEAKKKRKANDDKHGEPMSVDDDLNGYVEDDEDEDDEDDDEEEEEESELRKLYPETYKTKETRLLRTTSRPHSEEDEEEEEDIEYSPEEDEYKKTIMVGSEFQAQIPEGLCRYDDALPYENEDKLVWDPSKLEECDIEVYLQKVSVPVTTNGSSSNSSGSNTSNSLSPTYPPMSSNLITSITQLPCGSHLRDDEQSLYLLLQCGHNMEEALRRRRLNATVPSAVAVAAAAAASNATPGNDTKMSLWSEEECRNFESGLRIYGKDFHTIQQSKVRTRSVGELVQFYYLWKKTERHDIFANKARLEKKKYNLHPGLTDYMDRFLEEQENNGANINSLAANNSGLRDRSASPGVNCLLYTDFKRQRTSQTQATTSSTTITTAPHDFSAMTPINLNNVTKHSSTMKDPLSVSDNDIHSIQTRNNQQIKSNQSNRYESM